MEEPGRLLVVGKVRAIDVPGGRYGYSATYPYQLLTGDELTFCMLGPKPQGALFLQCQGRIDVRYIVLDRSQGQWTFRTMLQ